MSFLKQFQILLTKRLRSYGRLIGHDILAKDFKVNPLTMAAFFVIALITSGYTWDLINFRENPELAIQALGSTAAGYQVTPFSKNFVLCTQIKFIFQFAVSDKINVPTLLSYGNIDGH